MLIKDYANSLTNKVLFPQPVITKILCKLKFGQYVYYSIYYNLDQNFWLGFKNASVLSNRFIENSRITSKYTYVNNFDKGNKVEQMEMEILYVHWESE